MKIIASFPCLGRTTVFNLNRDRCMDRKFDTDKSIVRFGQLETDRFFDCCAEIVNLQYRANAYDIMFVDDDDRLIKRLGEDPALKKDLILVFPNIMGKSDMEEYIIRATGFYGIPWVNKNIKPKIDRLPDRVRYYRDKGYDIRFTNSIQKYIPDVISLPKGFVTPVDTDY